MSQSTFAWDLWSGDGADLFCGRTSPRLKDADLSPAQLPELYAELAIALRFMYQRCQLVHADFSEYNIL